MQFGLHTQVPRFSPQKNTNKALDMERMFVYDFIRTFERVLNGSGETTWCEKAKVSATAT